MPVNPAKDIFLIESGKVSMCYYTDVGTTVTIIQDGPGEFLGVKGAFRETERKFYAIADTDVRVWRIGRENFYALLREDFDFVLRVFSRFSLHLDTIERKMLNFFLSAKNRMVLTLLELGEQSEHKTDSYAQVSITQQELSNLLSVSRQTTFACLKELQDKGIIKTKRGLIEICDTSALRRELL
jgi:CRP-like cAMP-binding protein